MRNKIISYGVVGFIAYVLGARTPRIRVNKGESVGHQIVRLWNDPKAQKRRRKAAAEARKRTRAALRKARRRS